MQGTGERTLITNPGVEEYIGCKSEKALQGWPFKPEESNWEGTVGLIDLPWDGLHVFSVKCFSLP